MLSRKLNVLVKCSDQISNIKDETDSRSVMGQFRAILYSRCSKLSDAAPGLGNEDFGKIKFFGGQNIVKSFRSFFTLKV